MRLISSFLLFFSTLIFVNVIDAALVVMKNGNKIEGKFLNASNNEIQIEVASQVLKIKVAEISYVSFDGQTPKQGGAVAKQDQSLIGAKDAIRSLRAINSVLSTGVNYSEYKTRVNEAKIKVDEFLSNNKAGNLELNKHITDAMGYYAAAGLAWTSNINKNELMYSDLPRNQYCISCDALQKSLLEFKNRSKDLKWDKRKEGIAIGIMGKEPLWECAETSISNAEMFLK
jgi:hypothetical protein